MNILDLMGKKSEQYTQVQNKIQQLNNELLMLQGEYRFLKEMGVSQGILNEDGSPKEEISSSEE